MDLHKIKSLIDLVASGPIEQLEVEDGATRVRISRQASATLTSAAATKDTRPAPTSASNPEATTKPESGPILTQVQSPMFGVIYRSPSPTEPPFVSVGDNVTAGQTLCLIEAMKTLNKVEVDRPGAVREILVTDGMSVEEGQALFVIE